jgi:hypothetical protein
MLDTLKLSLDDFEVLPGADLELSSATVNTGTGVMGTEYPLWKNGRYEVRGVKAFHNGERVAITVKPRREAPGSQALCVVQFSVPKVAGGGNYHPADANATQEALNTVGKYLSDVGIKTNLERATVGRLDAAKTEAMREPFAGYVPVLSRLQGKRAMRRDYGSTMLWGNTRWEICGYDKREEMRRAKLRVDGLPPNPLRMELRAMKAAKVREMFGLKTVAELRDALDHVRQVYRSELEAQLFKHELPEETLLSRAELVEQLTAARDGSHRWFTAWLQAWAMEQLAPEAAALKDAVRLVAPDRQTANRICRQIEQGEREGMALRQVGPSRRTWGDLYNELRDKVLS